MTKVLIADKFPAAGVRALEALGATAILDPSLRDEALLASLAQHDPEILLVRSTRVTAVHLAAAPSLSLVIRAGAGVNTIDLETSSERGVYVANCPGKNSVAVAELAFAHLLSLDRALVEGAKDLEAGRWNKKKYSRARGVLGRRLGLLGLGGIGRAMLPRARAFGMTTVAWSRSLSPERAAALGVEYASSPIELARNCDVFSVHLALTDETRHLVGQAVLDALPDGALVINTSRGEVIDQDALAAAVGRKGLRVGLDVFADEPSGGEGALEPGIFEMTGVQGTHHIGASTEQAQQAVADEVVRIVSVYLSRGEVPNCVNLAVSTPATHLLVVRHADRVGVLAGVLECIRAAGLNVQEMENQVFEGHLAASARIQLTGDPGKRLADAIANLEDVFAVAVKEV